MLVALAEAAAPILVAVLSRFCPTVSRSNDIALGCSAEGAAANAIRSEGRGFCAITADRGATRPRCGCEFAIISLAASPYHCQSTVAATPMQTAIRKRVRG